MTVALVIVSHSRSLAEGVAEVAAQMADGVPIHVAGGTETDGIGTSFDRVEAAVTAADAASGGDGVVVLCDLGSAVMTAETYLDVLDDDARARIRLADAPLVEGAVAAGVEAAAGGSLDAVTRIAEAAWGRGEHGVAGSSSSAEGSASSTHGPARREVEVVNPQGMHARPAAMIVQHAAGFEADVRLNGTSAASLLSLLGLGLKPGHSVTIEAQGPDAEAAVDDIAALFQDGFGELETDEGMTSAS